MKNEIMSFEKCEKEFLHKVEIDTERINSFIKMAQIELEIISKMEINKDTASKIAKDYYEIIKDLLTALLLSEGLKSSNHECLISFVKHKYPELEYEANIIHELKNIRNRISYDGYFVNQDYITRNKTEFLHIAKILERLIKNSVPKNGQED